MNHAPKPPYLLRLTATPSKSSGRLIAPPSPIGDPTLAHPCDPPLPITGRTLLALLGQISESSGALDREVVFRLALRGNTFVGGLRSVQIDSSHDEEASIVLDSDDAVAVQEPEQEPPGVVPDPDLEKRVQGDADGLRIAPLSLATESKVSASPGVAVPPAVRDRLRQTIRAQIASYLQEDLDGGELYKETWEACEGQAERDVVRDEIRCLLRELDQKTSRERVSLDECPRCHHKSVRAKELHEGGGVCCITPGCGYWF